MDYSLFQAELPIVIVQQHACNGKFAKTVFFFMRTDEINSATMKITWKAVNKWKGIGKELHCSITFTGSKPMLDKLNEILYQLQ